MKVLWQKFCELPQCICKFMRVLIVYDVYHYLTCAGLCCLQGIKIWGRP